jgi:hypothetical protein
MTESDRLDWIESGRVLSPGEIWQTGGDGVRLIDLLIKKMSVVRCWSIKQCAIITRDNYLMILPLLCTISTKIKEHVRSRVQGANLDFIS